MRNRLGAVRFAEWLRASHWVAAVAIVLAVVLLRVVNGWQANEIWIAAGIASIWLLVGWMRTRVQLPDSLDALATFDKRGGWNDRFSSALFFLKNREWELDEGEALHLRKTDSLLPEAISKVPGIFPIPSLKWFWILPVIALAFAATPLLRPRIAAGDRLLTEEMQEAATEQADLLKNEKEKVANLDSLNKEEKEQLERLGTDVEQLTLELANPEGQTATEVLEALEARARAAEKLAEKMGLATDAWASEEMLSEMSQHPDTAELAMAIKDKQAEAAADESMALHDTLENPDIKQETADRIATALDRTMQMATEEDRTKPVGERVGNASRKMLSQQTQESAREFEELAHHFEMVEQREQSQEKLKKFAEKLREAGSQISGSKLEKMNKLAGGQGQQGNKQGGLKPLDSNPLQNQLQNQQTAMTPQPGQTGSQGASDDKKNQSSPPVPGSNQGENAKQQAAMSPVPGQGNDGDKGKKGGQGLADGKGEKGKGGNNMLSAPIPGMSSNTQPPGSSLGGSGSGSGQSGQGGDQAGTGTAEMVENETDTLKASRDAKVVAQVNEDGESTSRAIQGGTRDEQSERSRQEIMADFIAVEEQALDDQSIPRSRREQVLRYFSEIRRQFEENETQPVNQ